MVLGATMEYRKQDPPHWAGGLMAQLPKRRRWQRQAVLGARAAGKGWFVICIVHCVLTIKHARAKKRSLQKSQGRETTFTEFIENNPRISGPVQFTPMLVKGQVYLVIRWLLCTSCVPGPSLVLGVQNQAKYRSSCPGEVYSGPLAAK